LFRFTWNVVVSHSINYVKKIKNKIAKKLSINVQCESLIPDRTIKHYSSIQLIKLVKISVKNDTNGGEQND